MNALVNDQLGRLRSLFGDPRVVDAFCAWSGRPARFARYTGRTLYPGVRSAKRDQQYLTPIKNFYVKHAAASAAGDQNATTIVDELQKRGKWPAKEDIVAWYGPDHSKWATREGEFLRCICGPHDAELLTRHEVLAYPPDILVTNYSMLEYMLMRPLERPIFDNTAQWLHDNPDEKLLLVVDEAHLYRGAQGTEVALLIRRLMARLGITSDRLQVICTSASFGNQEDAASFVSQLTGKHNGDFDVIVGRVAKREGEHPGASIDAQILSSIDLEALFAGEDDKSRCHAVEPFLNFRQVYQSEHLGSALHEVLIEYPPLKLLANITMEGAFPVDELAHLIFPLSENQEAEKALTALMTLGSLAKVSDRDAGLLPCRIHSFHRGLPGLWACMDPECSALHPSERGGPTGKLYSQPRDLCLCGARVFELYTCRNCGTAYARAYTDNIDDPHYLWSEPGKELRLSGGDAGQLVPIDILLEDPEEDAEPVNLDIVTGQLNPPNLGGRTRDVYISPRHVGVRSSAGTGNGQAIDNAGEFRPCAVCGERGPYGSSTVQDHQTKGDQPFLALVSRQIQIQPPRMASSTTFAPLRGRKVLVFSDSRQTAARLAPSLQTQSARDAIRPLIIAGYYQLQALSTVSSLVSLEDLPLAVYLAAKQLGVRLRPEVHAGESFDIETRVEQAIEQNALSDAQRTLQLVLSIRSSNPPESLLHLLLDCITDRFYGIESLALATVVERQQHEAWPRLMQLPDLAGVAVTPEQKACLIRAWLQAWARKSSIWLSRMPTSWWGTNINGHSGKFEPFARLLGTSRKAFEREWLPTLLSIFCEATSAGQYRLRGTEVTLQVGGDWAYCSACRTTQRPIPGSTVCSSCGKEKVTPIDPDIDPVFVARKGYYRASACDVLSSTPVPPFSLIAAEHTAQLNTAQADKVFSTAEENELLFQDVDLGASDGPPQYAVDVLSCTTTMEVGIDIGALSGVSLRNMPPGRANYQQRAGRAGRRGESIATVVSFASSETHDEHFFSHPREMIRGEVDTPSLVLDNEDIAIRHVVAYLLQRYCQYRLPNIEPERMPGLFSVLGTVPGFIEGSSILNRNDFAVWLTTNRRLLASEIDNWLPTELSSSVRNRIIATFPEIALPAIDIAIGFEEVASQNVPGEEQPGEGTDVNDSIPPLEVNLAESGDLETVGNTTERLLDRLLYMGVLPRYAFPTDVATFHVFDRDRSTKYRPSFLYSPSQGLAVALSQYAPGKNLWIGNKLWTTGAIYSPMKGDIGRAWRSKRLYYECNVCHYAFTRSLEEGERHEKLDCVACGGKNTLGESKYWMRPVGFAHPVTIPEGTSPGDEVPKSYATRAKLFAPSPAEENAWVMLNEHLRVTHMREHLLVTNCGPKDEGYTFCTACGLIEPSAIPDGVVSTTHKKPFPPGDDCPGRASRGIVLGTDFVTDIMLVSLRVEHPLSLVPGLTATESALRTICEALRIAASRRLELDSGELQAEFRPALTPGGKEGIEAEIYIYDTLPGGAGFARRAKELGMSLFQDALHILESCAGGCDRSCYRCLRSFGNKFEHDQLDRHLGASLVRYLLNGELSFEQSRSEGSADILFEDLQRQASVGLLFRRQVMVPIPGIGTIQAPIIAYAGEDPLAIIGVAHPLAPSVPLHACLTDVMEYSTALPVYPKDEMLIRRNLPGATTDVIEHLSIIDRC